MLVPIILWAMVWGGMYSDITQFSVSSLLGSPTSFFMALRPLMPLLASLICLIILRKRETIQLSLRRGPFFSLTIYGLVGGLFFFQSPEPFASLYWAALFLSVIFIAWTSANIYDLEKQARAIIMFNWGIVIIMTFIMLLGPLWPILRGAHNPRLYELPLGLGIQTANGVGRFAGVACLIALSRVRQGRLLSRAFWIVIFAGSMAAVSVSESRTAILGFVTGAGLLVIVNRKIRWIILGSPGVIYLLYLSWFQWRFRGSVENALMMSGREYTWQKAIAVSLKSPLVGFGFHADRFILEGEHVHMAYLHSLIQSGIIGVFYFIATMVGIWLVVIKSKAFQRIHLTGGAENLLLTECIAVLGFLTARSFFESTAAFYGVDLLLLVPAVIYLQIWAQKAMREDKTNTRQPLEITEEESSRNWERAR